MNLLFAVNSVARYATIGLVIALAVLFIIMFMRRKSFSLRDFFGLFYRVIALYLLALVMAAPYRERETVSGTLPLLFDVSRSMDPVVGEDLFDSLKALEKDSLALSLYPFARKVSAVPFSLSDYSSFEEMQKAFNSLDGEGTALSDSLEALTNGKNAQSIVLASDGFETRGSIREKLALLNQRNARIYPMIPKGVQENRGMFRISQVYAPLTVPQLSSAQVRVTVENSTRLAKSGTLEILQGSQSLFRQTVKLTPESEQVYLAQTLPASGGIEKIRAVLTPADAPPSEESTFVSAEGREKILLLSGSSADAQYLGQVLANQAYQLDNRVGVSSLSSESLANYSAIILNNISMEQLGRSAADVIVRATHSGKGLIMVGGERSFGLGGYRGTVIEDALPVELMPPQREERRLNVAVMLVIDKSRSMDADRKMDYAKEAAREFITNLKDDDYIGVIAFDASPFIVVRLGQLAEIRSMASDRIGRIFPTGSTKPLTAIDEARRSLIRVNAGRKHMLFLTDGQIEDAGPHYKELVKQMRILGITSSTVMLGGEADGGFLRSLAEQGGGAYYQTNDARTLPRIFLNDVRVASGERTMREQHNYSVIAKESQLTSTEITDFPNLLGYVQTKTKSGANLEVVVSDGEKQEPLLARWKYGQGGVVAYTSDANGRWSRDWISWGSYHRFWNDLLNSVRPTSEVSGERIPFDMRQFVENGKLVIEYALYADDLAGTLYGKLKTPDQQTRDVSFVEVSPGRYRAEINDPLPGRYDIVGTLGKRSTAPVAFAIPEHGFVEQQGLGINVALLQQIARMTNAMVNPSADTLRSAGSRETERDDLSSWFIALAMFFVLLEIFNREVFTRRVAAYKR